MRRTFYSLRFVIGVIAVLIFGCGIILTVLGGYDLVMVFTHLGTVDKHAIVGLMAVSLLRAVDLFLIAIVFFVLSLGILMLFRTTDETLPLKLPEWLQVKNFMQLKSILWEAILTTLVVSYLAGLVQTRIGGEEITIQSLLLPAGVFIIALSLFFLKKGEKD
jgi:uncharacterized membrane protein YqhA